MKAIIKIKPIKLGYIFTYKADITDRIWSFADLHKIKIVDTLSIYSSTTNRKKIEDILKSREEDNKLIWPYDNEISYIDYKFVNVKQCKDIREDKIRKADFFDLGYKEDFLFKTILDRTGEKKIVVYTCYTNVNYLQYLQKKYTPKLRSKSVTKTHKKRKLSWVDPKSRVTFDNDPAVQRLVCITDGKTVHRLKQYLADRIVKRFPNKITFCSKVLYQQYKDKLTDFNNPNKTPKLFEQKKGGRKARRQPLQKQRHYSRYYKYQYVTGKWVDDTKNPGYQVFVECPTNEIKKIFQHTVPNRAVYTLPHIWGKTKKWRKPSKFETTTKEIQGIQISKLPYNQPMAILRKVAGADGRITNSVEQNVKMINKKIVRDDPTTKETVVLCTLGDIDKWCKQTDYKDLDKDETPWVPFVSVVPFTRTKTTRVVEHLPKRIKKTKKWRHPISVNGSERKHLLLQYKKV